MVYYFPLFRFETLLKVLKNIYIFKVSYMGWLVGRWDGRSTLKLTLTLTLTLYYPANISQGTHMGPMWVSIWAPDGNPIWAPYGMCNRVP